MDSLKKKVIQGVQWLAIFSVLSTILEFAKVGILARYLKPEDFGILAMITIFPGLMINIITGVATSVIPHEKNTDSELKSLSVLLFFIGIGLFLILFLGAPLLRYLYEEEQTVSLVRILGVQVLIVSVGNIYRQLLRKELYLKELSIISIIKSFIGAFFTIILALLDFGVLALIGGLLLDSLLDTLMCVYVGRKKLNWKPGLHFAWEDTKPYKSFGISRAVDFIVLSVINNIDYVIIGRLLGANVLGLYRMSYNVSLKIIVKIIPIFSNVLFPSFAKLKNDRNKVREGFSKSIKMLSFVLAPLLFGMSAVTPTLIPLYLGDSWTLISPMVQVLLFYAYIMALETPLKQTLLALGNANKVLTLNIISTVFLVIAIIIGYYINPSIYFIVKAIFLYKLIFLFCSYEFFLKKLMEKNLLSYIKLILPSLFINILMFICVYNLGFLLPQMSNVILLSIQVITGAVIYVIFSFFFLKKEVSLITQFLKR